MKVPWVSVMAVLVSSGMTWADCPPVQQAIVDSEAHCFPSGGINIEYYGEDGIKVACMRDKRVENACGPDGRLTRQQAFRQWEAKLQQFQVKCESDGGTFAFDDANFVEPTEESYCLQAQPEVGTNMFEDALCNFHSICPAARVSCTFDCTSPHSHTVVPGGPSGVTLRN